MPGMREERKNERQKERKKESGELRKEEAEQEARHNPTTLGNRSLPSQRRKVRSARERSEAHTHSSCLSSHTTRVARNGTVADFRG